MRRSANALPALLVLLSLTGLVSASINVKLVSASSSGLSRHVPILIDGPNAFTASNGVTDGDGSVLNPYVIQGWSIDASTANGIEIRDVVNQECHIENGTCVPAPTYFVIRNVFIHSETHRYADILLYNDTSPPDVGCFECSDVAPPAVVANSTLTDNANGIVLSFSNNILITGVTIKDTRTGIDCSNAAFIGIRTNRIANSVYGMNWSLCAVTDFFYNTVSDADYGILEGNTGSVDIEHNLIASPRGITFQESGSALVVNNRIIGQAGPKTQAFMYGIGVFPGSSGIYILNNTITNGLKTSFRSGSAGVNITSSSSVSLEGNTIQTGNSYGAFVHESGNVMIFHNNFLNNTPQAFDDNPSQNLWDSSYPSGGNFWSDFKGVDNCSGAQQNICPSPDGISDTPYAFNSNEDRYPLMELFS